jgi:hypothetical protein
MRVAGHDSKIRNSGLTARRAALLATSLVLGLATGCKPVGPDYKRPEVQAPATYKESGASAVIAPPLVGGLSGSAAQST